LAAAQMVLLSAQGMDVPAIAKVAFTSEDRVRDVIRNFNADGFGSLYPKYKGGRPPKFTLAQRQEIKKIAKAKPAEYDLPFSTWSLAKLADFVVAEGVVDDISHEGLRVGQGEQRRDRLYADEFVLVKPHRGAVHGAAVLRARRHRPRQP
jgi:transposase